MNRLINRQPKSFFLSFLSSRCGMVIVNKVFLFAFFVFILAGGIIGVRQFLMTTKLQSNLKTSTKVNLNLRQELNQISVQSAKYQTALAEYENKLKDLETKHLTESQQLSQLKDVEVRLREERSALKQKVAQMQEGGDGLQSQLDDASRRASDMEQKIKPLNEAKEELQKYKKDVLRFEQENKVMQEKVKESQEQRKSDLKAEKDRSLAAIEQAKTEHQKAVNKFQGEIKDLKDEMNDREAAQLKARTDLEKALQELNKTNILKTRLIKETADMHYNLGVIFLERKDFARAIQEFEKTVALRADDADAHYNLAIIYDERLKNSEKALEHYRAYLKIRPNTDEAQKIEKWIIDQESISKVAD